MTHIKFYQSRFSLINENATLGERCIIEPLVIIGHPEKWTSYDYINSFYSDIDELFKKYDSNISIGDDCVIRCGSVIYENVSIGKNFQCGSNVIIRSSCTIGNNAFIKNNSEIMRNVYIGNDCRISGIVGDFTKIGNNVHSYETITHKQKDGISEEERKRAPQIGNNVMIGRGAVVLGDIKIGNNVIIGANAFVDKDVSDNMKVIGINKKIPKIKSDY